MKVLNQIACQRVAGGEQYLAVVTKITYEGLPQSCVSAFYSNFNANPGHFTLESMLHEMITHCPALQSSYSIDSTYDVVQITQVER